MEGSSRVCEGFGEATNLVRKTTNFGKETTNFGKVFYSVLHEKNLMWSFHIA